MMPKIDVDTPSSAYATMLPHWEKIDALMGGTDAMRAARHRYLPQFDAESDEQYSTRVEKTFLRNYLRHTVEDLVGKPFAKPILVAETAPEEFRTMARDIDRQGRDLTRWARDVFQEGMLKAFTHVFVDFPIIETADGSEPTAQDERNAGALPYFVHVPPRNLLAAYAEIVNGVERLIHARIYERSIELDGYKEMAVERIRVMEPGRFRVFRRDKKRWDVEQEWTDSTIPSGEIPLRTFYADRQGFMLGQPPLNELADQNIEHWQSSSDQRNVLTVARFPILAASGVDPDAQVPLGPRKVLKTADPNGRFYYAEHSGAAINAGRQDLLDLEESMALFGRTQMLRKRPGDMTATGKAIDTAESHSRLEAMALDFGDFLNDCFSVAADWLEVDEPTEPVVTINTEFQLSLDDDFEFLKYLRTNRDISREALLSEAKRRDVLLPDFDIEADAQRILDEDLGIEPQAA